MLTIRLSRVGKKNKPMYRLVISEKARDPYGKALEILGSYNPHTKDLQVKNEKIKYWLSKGSQMSPTVNNLLIEKGIIEGEKQKASKAKKKKKAKEAKEKKPAESTAENAGKKDGSSDKENAPSDAKETPVEETKKKTEDTQKENKNESKEEKTEDTQK